MPGTLMTEKKQIVKDFNEYFNQLLNQLVVEEDNETIYYYMVELKIKNLNNRRLVTYLIILRNIKRPSKIMQRPSYWRKMVIKDNKLRRLSQYMKYRIHPRGIEYYSNMLYIKKGGPAKTYNNCLKQMNVSIRHM